jgi:hypothetical protein
MDRQFPDVIQNVDRITLWPLHEPAEPRLQATITFY